MLVTNQQINIASRLFCNLMQLKALFTEMPHKPLAHATWMAMEVMLGQSDHLACIWLREATFLHDWLETNEKNVSPAIRVVIRAAISLLSEQGRNKVPDINRVLSQYAEEVKELTDASSN